MTFRGRYLASSLRFHTLSGRPIHKSEYAVFWTERGLTAHFHTSTSKFWLCLEDIKDSTGLENEQILQTSMRWFSPWRVIKISPTTFHGFRWISNPTKLVENIISYYHEGLTVSLSWRNAASELYFSFEFVWTGWTAMWATFWSGTNFIWFSFRLSMGGL